MTLSSSSAPFTTPSNESAPMQLQLFDNFESLCQQSQNWDAVAGAFPFQRWAWLGSWFEHLAADAEPVVLVATENGTWTGIAPFFINRKSRDNCLRFWGSGKACTDYAGLICKPEKSDEFTLAVVDWIFNEGVSGGLLQDIDLIELEGLTAERSADQRLLQTFEACGFDSHSVELEGCWETKLPPSWEELNKRLSKSMRRKTKKAVQRTSDEACEIISSDDVEFEWLWPQFVGLHQQRREMLGQAGCFADQNFERFLQQASEKLIAERRAELILINFDGLPLASMLLFNDVSTNYMYQSGADCTRMKLEPGYQLALVAIQKSIENGFQKFDFLRGDEPYKSRWDTRRVPILRSRLVPRKLKAMIKHNAWLTGQLLRQYLRPTQ